MQGDIIVTSKVNAGSQFTIDLPRYYSKQRQNPRRVIRDCYLMDPAEIENQSNPDYPTVATLAKVLIIDDDAATRDVIERHQSDGYAVMSSGMGRRAAKCSNLEARLDSLDINMPGKNGWQVLKRSKKMRSF